MRLGYNTNGLAHHRWDDAINLIAATGYRSVAITVDHHCLDPNSATFRQDLRRMRALLEKWDLRCVVETGARFLLDPDRKHQPTLLSAKPNERELRLRFLGSCVEIAAELEADAVSFWSGSPTDHAADEILWTRLVDGCRRLVDIADAHDVRLAFEPEPGMFIETCAQFENLLAAVDHPRFGMTLDVGHVHCLQDGDIADRIRQFAPLLFNLHIEDMLHGAHEHLRFGAGTIDFPPIFRALSDLGYQGGLHVELSRHSHMAPTVLHESYVYLSECLGGVPGLPT